MNKKEIIIFVISSFVLLSLIGLHLFNESNSTTFRYVNSTITIKNCGYGSTNNYPFGDKFYFIVGETRLVLEETWVLKNDNIYLDGSDGPDRIIEILEEHNVKYRVQTSEGSQ